MEQRPGDQHPLFHTVRVFLDLIAGALGQPNLRQDLLHTRLPDAVEAGKENQVLAGRHAFIDILAVEHHTDPGFELLAFGDDIATGHFGGPGGGQQLTGQHADGGGLAGAVGTQETEDLTRLHAEADPIHGAQAVIISGQVAHFDCLHLALLHLVRRPVYTPVWVQLSIYSIYKRNTPCNKKSANGVWGR